MAPKNKKKMKTQQEEEKCDVDRLSSLPYNLLHHILSFLDTKSAVRTSVLSKRYRYAWASLPCLDFKLTIANVHYFKASVSHVLQSREPCSLRSFRLSLHLPVASQFIKKCIDYAAQHRVQHLRIRGFTHTGYYSYTGLQSTFKLPTLLLASTSLVTLRLNNAVSETSELPTSVSLPNLKGLSLKNFVFSETNYNGELFSGCPNLENLVLIKCSIKTKDELKILDVNCSNLKSLEIRNWRSPWECFDEHVIHVNAPGLVFFKFEGFLARVDFKNIMPCLKEAYIDLSYPTKCPSDRVIRTSESLLSLLQQISNVKFLSLLSKTFQVMSVKPESRKTTVSLFENLEIVEVRAQSLMKKLKRLFWPPEL